MIKHLIANLLLRSFRNFYHDQVIRKRPNNPDNVNQSHRHNRLQQTCKIRIALSNQRSDVIIDHDLQKQWAPHIRKGADQDHEKDNDQLHFMLLRHNFQKAFDCFHRAGFGHRCFIHHGHQILSVENQRLLDRWHYLPAAHHAFQHRWFFHRPIRWSDLHLGWNWSVEK